MMLHNDKNTKGDLCHDELIRTMLTALIIIKQSNSGSTDRSSVLHSQATVYKDYQDKANARSEDDV